MKIGFKDYLAVMSPYNFDPEADALRRELKEARKNNDLRAVRTRILTFIARKKAAAEATK